MTIRTFNKGTRVQRLEEENNSTVNISTLIMTII